MKAPPRLLSLVSVLSLFAGSHALAQDRAPRLWLAGVDPAVQARKHVDQPSDYMDLFQPDAPWRSAASKVDVFEMGTEMVLRGSDAQLHAIIDDLKARRIMLAISMGLIGGAGPDGCGQGVEGYSALRGPEAAARRIKALGGQIDYIAMDEPVWFGHVAANMSGGRRGCRYSIAKLTDIIAPQIDVLRRYFPDIRVGDIEPVSASPSTLSLDPRYMADVSAFVDQLQDKARMKLAFLHADVAWKWGWKSDMAEMARQARMRGIPFGVICDGDVDSGGDQAWVRQALQRCQQVMSDPQTLADSLIVQSWEPLPTRMLPESDPGSLTYEANAASRLLR